MTSAIDASNMASVVASMNAEFGMLRRAAEHAEATVLVLPENGARKTRAARRGASVRCVNGTLEDEDTKDTEDRRSEGRAFST